MPTWKPVPIPFPLSSAPGAFPHESGGRLINAYAEPLSQSGPGDRVYRRVPGLLSWGTTTRTGFRGMIEVGNFLYSAWANQLVSHVAAGGAGTNLGTLNGTQRGFFARNNRASPGPDIVWCDPGSNIAYFTPGGSVNNGSPDTDVPGSVTSVAAIDGYIVFGSPDGRVFASGLNNLSFDPLSVGAAEFKPDGLVRVVVWTDLLLLMGNATTEIWTDQGLIPFPFQRTTVIPRGLIGPYAVAGYEDRFSKALIWVGDDGCVYLLAQGYTPDKISSPDIDRAIEGVTDKTTIDCCSYMTNGHAMFEMSCPTFTWVFDLNNKQWHERKAYQQQRSRIIGAVNGLGRWVAGDTLSGNLNEITAQAAGDVGNPLRFRLESGPVSDFPNRAAVGRADFFFDVGIGIASGIDPIQTDPQVELSWSDNGGFSWSNSLLRKLGRQGMGQQRVTILNVGSTGSYGRRWRIDVTDPVYVGFVGATQATDPRAF